MVQEMSYKSLLYSTEEDPRFPVLGGEHYLDRNVQDGRSIDQNIGLLCLVLII